MLGTNKLPTKLHASLLEQLFLDTRVVEFVFA